MWRCPTASGSTIRSRICLLPHSKDDIRAQTGEQDFVGVAALDLIYVAHGERMTDVGPEERRLTAAANTGFIGQNVYLYCASEGLGCVFRGALDHEAVGKLLRLPDGQFVTFAQTVGLRRAVIGGRRYSDVVRWGVFPKADAAMDSNFPRNWMWSEACRCSRAPSSFTARLFGRAAPSRAGRPGSRRWTFSRRSGRCS